jgi:hypothetical protein
MYAFIEMADNYPERILSFRPWQPYPIGDLLETFARQEALQGLSAKTTVI